MKKAIQLILSLLSVSFLWGGAIAQAVNDQQVLVEKTGITIQKPEGFEKADAFHGFQQVSTGASVMITLLPGPYAEVSQGLTQDMLAKQGIQLLDKQSTTIADQPALLLHLSQDAYGQTYMKWVAVFGDAAETRIVTATFPNTEADRLSETLRRVVLSSMLTDKESQASPLPFEIGNVAGLTRVEKLAGIGKVAAFSKTGLLPVSSPSEPLFIVAPSLDCCALSGEGPNSRSEIIRCAKT